ncbi:MAG TPA: glycoside hydrolase family 19 protein [Chroococcidiopsis sp.]
MFRRLVSILLVFLIAVIHGTPQVLAAAIAPGEPAIVPTMTVQGITIPDWSRMSFASLPPVQAGGQIAIAAAAASRAGDDPSRSWSPGTSLADLLTLGDLQHDFALEQLTLAAIAQITGLDLAQVRLANFGLLKQQTISSLVAAIPGLGDYPVAAVKPLAALIAKYSSNTVSWSSERLAPLAVFPILAAATAPTGQTLKAIASDSTLGQLPLHTAALEQYSLNDIPGLSQTSLGEFAGWQQAAISTVPGLADVPFKAMPQSMGDFLGFVAIDDVTYGDSGDKEHTQTLTAHSITGSDRVGFHYPCVQTRSCAYLELASPTFLGNFGSPELHGAQWIKGGTEPGGQMVAGGHGILAEVNGGKEPTGRLPFGSAVKVVLVSDNEAEGRGDFALFFRICHSFLGCTPYFIGPVPFYSVHEKGVVIVGLTTLDKPGWIQQPSTPADVQSIIDANQDPNAPQINQSCLSSLVGDVKSGDEEAATGRIPDLLQAAQKAGITDPAQVAYILSTAQTEDDFTPQDEGNDSFKQSGHAGSYYGRGDVQLTWKSNYQYWSNRLGVDLVNHPELANRSDIAADILVYGMRDGTFTGQKLSDYLNTSTGHLDYVGARHIINDSDKAELTGAAAQQFEHSLEHCSTLETADNGGPTTTGNYPGQLIHSADGNATEQKIVQSINAHYGESSANGPDNGNEACAYEVNQVLQSSVGHKIGSNPNYVPSVEAALKDGAGTQVSAAQSHAGDVVVFQGSQGEHIGFCMDNGCYQVVSNSSSRAQFSWVGDRSSYDAYYHSSSSQHIYRVNG